MRFNGTPRVYNVPTLATNQFYWNSWMFNHDITNPNVGYASNNSVVQGNKVKIVNLGFNMDVKMKYRATNSSTNISSADSFTYRVICWRIPVRLGPYYNLSIATPNAIYNDVVPIYRNTTDSIATQHGQQPCIFQIPGSWTVIPTYMQYNPQGIAPYKIIFDKVYTLTVGQKTFRSHRYRIGRGKILQWADQNTQGTFDTDQTTRLVAVKRNLYGISMIICDKDYTIPDTTFADAEVVVQQTYAYCDN